MDAYLEGKENQKKATFLLISDRLERSDKYAHHTQTFIVNPDPWGVKFLMGRVLFLRDKKRVLGLEKAFTTSELYTQRLGTTGNFICVCCYNLRKESRTGGVAQV
jgi:hypothetical protein